MTNPTPPDHERRPATILVVDDEPGIREAYVQFLAPPSRPRGVASHRLTRSAPLTDGVHARVLVAATGEEAVAIVRAEREAGRRIQAGFFDMRMPGGIDGVETIRRVLEVDAELLCIVVTAYTDQPLDGIRALFAPDRQDDWDYISKPFGANEVLQKARNAIASWWRRRDEEAQAHALEAQIADRTRLLSAANAELETSQTAMRQVLADLQLANDRLRVEMAERSRLEEERRLASKLEGIGQLAAGIAHEINTPTQYILSNAELLEVALGALFPEVEQLAATTARCGDADRQDAAKRLTQELPTLKAELDTAVQAMIEGAHSIARIVGAMREFARIDPPAMCPADLARALHGTLEVVRHEYRSAAEIALDLAPLPLVLCHVGEVQQVFANLVINAAHAIASRPSPAPAGRITIAARHDAVRAQVVFTFTDNGTGIAPAHRERVFEPFFTTKPVGRGSGQGLSLARSIALRHQGSLEFESSVGVGTRFTLILPLAGQEAPP